MRILSTSIVELSLENKLASIMGLQALEKCFVHRSPILVSDMNQDSYPFKLVFSL